jgi:hypothetical protein
VSLKKIWKFAKKNYFITASFAVILFVGIVSFYKLFAAKPTYVYTKVKLGQGLWWSLQIRPNIWFATSLKKGDKEYDLLGKPAAEILGVKYYPYYYPDQYDVYLTVRLKTSYNKKSDKYLFKRSSVSVGAPIELEFSSAQVSGTVIDLSSKEFADKYIEKTIYLTKKSAYPWEYDAIKIGDKYFDGENNVFEILGKSASDNPSLSVDRFSVNDYIPSTENLGPAYPVIPEVIPEGKKYIVVKAKILVKEKNNQLLFGEEQTIRPGKLFNLFTSNFAFNDFVVGKIE